MSTTRTRADGEGSIRPWRWRRGGLKGPADSTDKPVQYQGRIRIDGRRKPFYGPTPKAVADAMREARTATERAPKAEGAAMTVSALIDEFVPRLAKRTLAPNTLRGYLRTYKNHVRPALGDHRLRELLEDPELLEDFYGERHHLASLPTVIHTSLRHLFDYAVLRKYLPRNLCDAVAGRPSLRYGEMQPLDRVGRAALLADVEGDELEALYTAAVIHGFRQGELLALKWGEYRPPTIGRKGAISVVATLCRNEGRWFLSPPKTKRSRRQVVLAPTVVAAFERHRQRREAAGQVLLPESFVFTDDAGQPLPAWRLNEHWNGVRRRLGVRVRFHDLRHTAATLALLSGVNVKVVSEMLGHSSVSFTADRYLHVLETMQDEAADRIEASL